MESKFWEDVEAGETLPVLEFPITVKTLILAVCGTRDLMPYHHDPEYSKSVGNRDMFVNTMFEQALFGRYVTDFAGPESDFRETGLQMLNQLCPGDIARVEGTVTEKLEEGGEKRIKLQLSAANDACARPALLEDCRSRALPKDRRSRRTPSRTPALLEDHRWRQTYSRRLNARPWTISEIAKISCSI